MSQFIKNYNLEDRTEAFSERIIGLYKKCPITVVTNPLINQGIRSGTSIGANYQEANGASSKKDFKNKIFTCKKESKETAYWLRLIIRALDDEQLKAEGKALYQEASEFILIFSKIASNTKV